MAHSIFVALFFAFLTRATVNFPCGQIDPSRTGYGCSAVGWCKNDYESVCDEEDECESEWRCVEDECIRNTTQSGSCGVDCVKKNRYSEYDCESDTYFNKSGFYCDSEYNYLSDCFYNGSLSGGSCGKGCRTVTLGGKTACIRDYDYDECNDFESEDLCHFSYPLCFWQNGKCVMDWCAQGSVSGTEDCFPRTNCVARDVYFYDDYDGEYYTYQVCLDIAHTTYQQCLIDINEYVPNGTGYCEGIKVHSEYCTGKAGCKVVTFEGKSVCSSLDPPSSSFLVRVPSVFVLLAVVLALFLAP